MQSSDRVAGEPQVSHDLPRDLADKPLKRQLPDQEVGGLLELADLAKGSSARPEPPLLLDPPGGGKFGGMLAFAAALGGKVIARALARAGILLLTLLGASHGAGVLRGVWCANVTSVRTLGLLV